MVTKICKGGYVWDGKSIEAQFNKVSYPKPGYSPVTPSYAAAYDYVYPPDVSHGYTLHYLPYEDYVPYHAETKAALKKNLPTVPGS